MRAGLATTSVPGYTFARRRDGGGRVPTPFSIERPQSNNNPGARQGSHAAGLSFIPLQPSVAAGKPTLVVTDEDIGPIEGIDENVLVKRADPGDATEIAQTLNSLKEK